MITLKKKKGGGLFAFQVFLLHINTPHLCVMIQGK